MPLLPRLALTVPLALAAASAQAASVFSTALDFNIALVSAVDATGAAPPAGFFSDPIGTSEGPLPYSKSLAVSGSSDASDPEVEDGNIQFPGYAFGYATGSGPALTLSFSYDYTLSVFTDHYTTTPPPYDNVKAFENATSLTNLKVGYNTTGDPADNVALFADELIGESDAPDPSPVTKSGTFDIAFSGDGYLFLDMELFVYGHADYVTNPEYDPDLTPPGAEVPLPASGLLLASVLAGLGIARRRRPIR